jgi:putative heme degradation protein
MRSVRNAKRAFRDNAMSDEKRPHDAVAAKDCMNQARQIKAELDSVLEQLEAMGYLIEINRKTIKIHRY